MTLLQRTVTAFPKGRTTEELMLLLGAEGDGALRRSVLAELNDLQQKDALRLGRDGKWRIPAVERASDVGLAQKETCQATSEVTIPDVLLAVPASFRTLVDRAEGTEQEDAVSTAAPQPQKMLRYWRSALRADPRGAITQSTERHGEAWQLITGAGPLIPQDGQQLAITIDAERLPPTLREALSKRQANENSLAVGWPLAIARQTGVPVVQPVGLIAATWERSEGQLRLTVDTDDVQVNPDWLKRAARASGWSDRDLAAQFDADAAVGLTGGAFLERLREVVARQVRGKLTGRNLTERLVVDDFGIHDSAALFLPTDTTFTAGAVRDLDRIATWSNEELAQTALAPFLGLQSPPKDPCVPINAGPLNDDQFRAVRHACAAPLTVVTGPPGTGKSQAIVSIAASVILQGGRVLITSKNHQALDAVEERLGNLASSVPFMVRTLDPSRDLDQGMGDVLTDLLQGDGTRGPQPAQQAVGELLDKGRQRVARLEAQTRAEELSQEIAEVLEQSMVPDLPPEERSFWQRLLTLLRLRKATTRPAREIKNVAKLVAHRAALDLEGDPVEMAHAIAADTVKLAPEYLSDLAMPTEAQRLVLADAQDAMAFDGAAAKLTREVADRVVMHRPLWLASILGTPRRVPLEAGLFDLVVFDEASQCDIAAALPLLARAKRAVIVGDDQQLNFIPQIGRQQDKNLMQAQGLDPAQMRGRAQSLHSLFGCANRIPGAAKVTLRQQYRSAADIVEYISETFYRSALVTAHSLAGLKAPEGQKTGLVWTDVPAPQWDGQGNINRAEIAAITAHLEELLVQQGYDGSIGVTSPFRQQAEALRAAIEARLPADLLERAEFKSATVDSFQGQERDVILFSPCLGRSSKQSAISFVQKDKRRLNVAISRARAVAHVFGDLGFARSGKVTELRRLAARATEPRQRAAESRFDSLWEERLYYALCARGLKPKPQYEIMGRRLDMALFGPGGIKLDVEVDGRKWHMDTDGNRKLPDLWRDHQLQSAGWRVRRFWVDELNTDMEACLDDIQQALT